MDKTAKFSIIASFFALWLVSYLSTINQSILGFILILSFGILHGANDLMLILNLKRLEKSISLPKILIFYVSIVFCSVLLFYFFSQCALFFFVVISCYHFGEQQLQFLEPVIAYYQTKCFQFIYGWLLFALLFYFHQQEVQHIILQIAHVVVPVYFFGYFLQFAIAATLLFLTYIYVYKSNLRKTIILEVFYLLVLTIIFSVSSLIWGFAIYFIIWHSIPSINDQMKFLFGTANFLNFKLYFKSAFLYWIISLFALAILYYLLKDQQIFLSLFFSFLAAITFPHVLVIVKMLKKS